MAINWLLFNAKPKRIHDLILNKSFTFKVNFVTLTLPSKQLHSDQDIKDVCLNNFITVARKEGLENYIWRAEAQPSTGNIHFHIITDMYIHYSKIQRWWNQSVELLGYVSAFKEKFHHSNPNSTDVHSVKHVRKLAPYLSKYCSKNRSFSVIGELRKIKGELVEVLYNSPEYHSENANQKKGQIVGHVLGERIRPIEGRLWACSQSLAGKKSIVFDGQEWNVRPFFEFVKQADFYCHNSQYCDSYYGNVADEARVYMPRLYQELVKYFDTGIKLVPSS